MGSPRSSMEGAHPSTKFGRDQSAAPQALKESSMPLLHSVKGFTGAFWGLWKQSAGWKHQPPPGSNAYLSWASLPEDPICSNGACSTAEKWHERLPQDLGGLFHSHFFKGGKEEAVHTMWQWHYHNYFQVSDGQQQRQRWPWVGEIQTISVSKPVFL